MPGVRFQPALNANLAIAIQPLRENAHKFLEQVMPTTRIAGFAGNSDYNGLPVAWKDVLKWSTIDWCTSRYEFAAYPGASLKPQWGKAHSQQADLAIVEADLTHADVCFPPKADIAERAFRSGQIVFRGSLAGG